MTKSKFQISSKIEISMTETDYWKSEVGRRKAESKIVAAALAAVMKSTVSQEARKETVRLW